MKAKRILIGILAAAMMMTLAGCGESDSPESTGSTQESSATTSVSKPESTPDSTPDSGKVAAYQLPAGAESEYALYKTVVDYLNNGFHPNDLKDVYDPNLTFDFYSKRSEKFEEILTLGMKYEEACTLIEKLRDKTSKILEENGDPEERDEDDFYNALRSELPEHMQSQFDDNHELLAVYMLNLVRNNYYNYDSENPFGTDQSAWEAKSENELDITEYDGYYKWDSDLKTNFPPVYYIDFGNYQSGGSVYQMGIYFTKIENRYYFIDFTVVIGNAGG